MPDTRRTDIQRESRPASHELFESPEKKAHLEARNGLCARIGQRLNGTNTIPEQIVANREPYYKALDQADAEWSNGNVDVGTMEKLIEEMLAVQLSSVLDAASSEGLTPEPSAV